MIDSKNNFLLLLHFVNKVEISDWFNNCGYHVIVYLLAYWPLFPCKTFLPSHFYSISHEGNKRNTCIFYFLFHEINCFLQTYSLDPQGSLKTWSENSIKDWHEKRRKNELFRTNDKFLSSISPYSPSHEKTKRTRSIIVNFYFLIL